MMNPRSIGSSIVWGAALVVSITAQTRAQPIGQTIESIETTVVNADLVIIATIERIIDDPGLPEHVKGVSLLVEETLKVPPEDDGYEKLFVHLLSPAPTVAQWERENRRLLVTVQEESLSASSAIDLEDEDLEVLTADLTILRAPEDLIRVARETIARMPANVKRIHTFRLDVPREIFSETRWREYDSLRVRVPVDDRLERRAHESIQSADLIKRLEGVRALRYFKSDENIAKLKPLLDDPGSILRRDAQGQEIESRHFIVRQEAYRTLKAWGVEIEPPLIRQKVNEVE